MNIEEMKAKVNSTEYEFIRTNEHLGDNIILLTTGGSHSYGTNVETSDLDIRGVAVERKQEVLGLGKFEQFENKETDTTIYGLKKYIGLILNCNPNTIEILGTKDEHLLICNDAGKLLRDNIDVFLSKKAIGSFGGYANAQLRRLENALARDEYPQPEKEKHILGTINAQFNHFCTHYEDLTGQSVKLYIDKSNKEDYEEEIFMDLSLNHYPLRDFKGIYSEMHNVISEYGKLNHRNNKKDEPHLLKHSMHLIRLFIMGIEILEEGKVITYREKDKNLLLDIRNGKYSYEEIFEMAKGYEEKFNYAANNTNLPAKPNYHRAEELLIEIYNKLIK